MAEITEAGQVDKPSDFDADGKGIVKRWLAEIKRAQKVAEKWDERCDKIIKRYKDERGDTGLNESSTRKFNVLWANMQILQPAIYAHAPKPIVDRRFLDGDPVGRSASQILERSLITSIDQYDFNEAMYRARDDFLLCARGQVWVRFIPFYGEIKKADDGTEFKPVVSEEARAEYLARRDFVHQPAPYWERVGWVAKRVHLSYAQLSKRFGKEIADKIPLKDEEQGGEKERKDEEKPLFARAPVWEIWDKEPRKVLWICPDYEDATLDEINDPLGLQDFFPCPRPLLGTIAPDSMIPIPDYYEYQDQALEMDSLTERIHYLTKALKVNGGYNAATPELGNLLGDSENTLVPVDNWNTLQEGGGLKSQIEFLPIDMIQLVLTGLVQVRSVIKADLDEISGMSDIIRGQGQASESATAQKIKGNYVTLRLQDKQSEMERFVRDVLRIKSEIMAEHFQPRTLREMSGFDYLPENNPETEPSPQIGPDNKMLRGHNGGPPLIPPMPPGASPAPSGMVPPPGAPGVPIGAQQAPGGLIGPEAIDAKFAKAMALLKNDKMRTFRVSVETESTIGMDRDQEKKDRTEFIMATAQFLQNAQNIGMQVPELMEPLAQTLLFGMRGFRVGRVLEQSFETAIQKLSDKQKAMAGQAPPPNPDVLKIQSQEKIAQGETQMHLQVEQMKEQNRVQLEQAKIQIEQMKLQMDQTLQQMKDQTAIQVAEIAAHSAAQTNEHKTGLEQIKGQMQSDSAMREQQHKSDLEQMKAEMTARLEERRMNMEQAANQESESVRAALEMLKQHSETQRSLTEAHQKFEGAAESTSTAMEHSKHLAETTEKVHEGMQAMGKGLEALAAAISRPKKLVRGPDGRAAGIE